MNNKTVKKIRVRTGAVIVAMVLPFLIIPMCMWWGPRESIRMFVDDINNLMCVWKWCDCDEFDI